MSEISNWPTVRNHFDIGNNRYGGWKSLRFMVSRDSTPWLTVALITTPLGGHPTLDAGIRGLQVAWDPRLSEGDVRLYAIQQALSGVTQTRR
jgi:hypothetical protein